MDLCCVRPAGAQQSSTMTTAKYLPQFAYNCDWFQCATGYGSEGDEGPDLRVLVPAYLIDHLHAASSSISAWSWASRLEQGDALPEEIVGLEWFEGMYRLAPEAIDVDRAGIHWIVHSHLAAQVSP